MFLDLQDLDPDASATLNFFNIITVKCQDLEAETKADH
jgi:hypothetical protein